MMATPFPGMVVSRIVPCLHQGVGMEFVGRTKAAISVLETVGPAMRVSPARQPVAEGVNANRVCVSRIPAVAIFPGTAAVFRSVPPTVGDRAVCRMDVKPV